MLRDNQPNKYSLEQSQNMTKEHEDLIEIKDSTIKLQELQLNESKNIITAIMQQAFS